MIYFSMKEENLVKMVEELEKYVDKDFEKFIENLKNAEISEEEKMKICFYAGMVGKTAEIVKNEAVKEVVYNLLAMLIIVMKYINGIIAGTLELLEDEEGGEKND